MYHGVHLDTLKGISAELGLNPHTLNVVVNRAAKRGHSYPKPVRYVGPKNGIPLYDSVEVQAWYLARKIMPVATRGPDKQPRKKRTA